MKHEVGKKALLCDRNIFPLISEEFFNPGGWTWMITQVYPLSSSCTYHLPDGRYTRYLLCYMVAVHLQTPAKHNNKLEHPFPEVFLFFGNARYMCCHCSRKNAVPSPQKHMKQTHLLALKQVDLSRILFPSGQFKRGSKCSVIASNQHRWIETNVSPSGKKYK